MLVAVQAAQSEQLLAELEHEQDTVAALQHELEVLRRSSNSSQQQDAPAGSLAEAAKDAEIAALKHEVCCTPWLACIPTAGWRADWSALLQMADFEVRALEELGEMHDELLELRETCFKLQIELSDSERKRCASLLQRCLGSVQTAMLTCSCCREKMQMDRQMVEQSLQEAGEDVADLHRQLSASQSRAGVAQAQL